MQIFIYEVELIFSLRDLLMQKSFLDLLQKREGDRSVWEYPFAVAGVNITFMLIQMLDLEAGYFLEITELIYFFLYPTHQYVVKFLLLNLFYGNYSYLFSSNFDFNDCVLDPLEEGKFMNITWKFFACDLI